MKLWTPTRRVDLQIQKGLVLVKTTKSISGSAGVKLKQNQVVLIKSNVFTLNYQTAWFWPCDREPRERLRAASRLFDKLLFYFIFLTYLQLRHVRSRKEVAN